MPRGVHDARRKSRRDRELVTRDVDGTQAYGSVSGVMGNGRFTVVCDDAVERRCKVRGSMRRREWVHANDVVLVSLRCDLGDPNDKADIVRVFSATETAQLRRFGELAVLEEVLRRKRAEDDPDAAACEDDVVFDDDPDDIDAL
jgi:initiation factor 1A